MPPVPAVRIASASSPVSNDIDREVAAGILASERSAEEVRSAEHFWQSQGVHSVPAIILVVAINSMFTGTSGTLGEFRAGAVAAAFGAFTSVLVGGVGAVLVALLWMRLFPEIRRIDSLGPKH